MFEDSVEEYQLPGENFTLSFQVITPVAAPDSRVVDEQGHEEVGSEYSSFEDGIDVNDLALFVFASPVGGAEENLVLKTTDFRSNSQLSISGTEGNFIINLTFPRSQLKEALGFDVDPNSDRLISFRMLMMANSDKNAAAWEAIDATDFNGIISQLNAWTFPMADLYEAPANGTDDPDIRDLFCKKGIPMFGTNTFSVAQDVLYESRPDNRIYLGELSLLRSLAKVRIVDNIQVKDRDGYPKIVGVTVFGTQSTAHQLPADAANYIDGHQVHTPNIANPDVTMEMTNAVGYRLGTIPDSWIEPSVDHTGSVRIGFIPEQQINYLSGDDRSKGLPFFRITLATVIDDEGNVELRYFDVPMIKFPDFVNAQNILRNHIYTISVDNAESDLTLTVKLVPWIGKKVDYTFGFDDLVPWTRPQNPNV